MRVPSMVLMISLSMSLELSLEDKFRKYHEDNPHVFELLVRFSYQLKNSKRRRKYGIAAVFERLRWHIDIETNDPDGFKINNSYRSFYVRMIEEKHPDLIGLYRKRAMRSLADPAS